MLLARNLPARSVNAGPVVVIRSRLLRAGQPAEDVDCATWQQVCADRANLLWIDAATPSADELSHLFAAFGVTEHAAAILRHTNRRPIVRVYHDHFLVTALGLDVREDEPSPSIKVIELDLLVGRNFLISIHKRPRPLPFGDELEQRVASNPHLGRLPATYLLYVLLDTVVGGYSREFDEVEDNVERLEEQLLREPGRSALDRATLLKRHVLNLRRLVAPHREAFGILAAADIPLIREENVQVYFRDLLEHVEDVVDRLDHARDVLTGAFNLYISNISHRSNQELRVLTLLSAVLLPMTVITGLFGTNFALTEYASWQLFYVMLAGMGLLAAAMLGFMRWRHWL